MTRAFELYDYYMLLRVDQILIYQPARPMPIYEQSLCDISICSIRINQNIWPQDPIHTLAQANKIRFDHRHKFAILKTR